ncbi:hypothetical protein [Thiocapsa sp. C4-3m]|uniref:hypothetical protein n=1 Tax=Thiocapsa sp. C4-3m TaxID=3137393 RepID=UPI0035AF70B5
MNRSSSILLACFALLLLLFTLMFVNTYSAIEAGIVEKATEGAKLPYGTAFYASRPLFAWGTLLVPVLALIFSTRSNNAMQFSSSFLSDFYNTIIKPI